MTFSLHYDFFLLFVLSFIVFCGFLIQGVTGFGATLFTMSFAILLFPRNQILPICLLYTLLQTTFIVSCEFRHINIKQFFIILSLALIFGMPLGFFAIRYLNEDILKFSLSLFIFVYSGRELIQLKTRKERDISVPDKCNIYMYILPILSGCFETAFGIGGPLIMAYLSKMTTGKKTLRATVSLYWVILNGAILIWGCFVDHSLSFVPFLTWSLMPAVIFGGIAGTFLSKCMSYRYFLMIVHVILLISSILINYQLLFA